MLTVIGTAAVLVGALMSIQLAHAWGEMAGIAPGGDKSGLGGLFVVLVLGSIRWLAVAIALACGISNRAFDTLVAGHGAQFAILLGAHLLLGLASYLGFTWVANGLTRDHMGPQRFSWLFGVMLPLPTLLLAAWSLYPARVERHPRLALLLAAALVLAHIRVYQVTRDDMRATAARRAVPVSEP